MPRPFRAALTAVPFAAATVLAAVLAGPGAAGASSTPTTAHAPAAKAATATTAASTTTTSTTVPVDPAARTQAAAAISVRITALNGALTLIHQTTWLAGSDQSALASLATNDLNGLTALNATLAAETDGTKFKAEAQSIYSTYRVYALALPQVHLVRAADRLTADAVPNLQKTDSDLAAAIAEQEADGRDVSGAQAAVADLATQIAAVQHVTTGASARLLALTPAQWNANHQIVVPFRTNLTGAVTALDQARHDVQTALKDLR